MFKSSGRKDVYNTLEKCRIKNTEGNLKVHEFIILALPKYFTIYVINYHIHYVVNMLPLCRLFAKYYSITKDLNNVLCLLFIVLFCLSFIADTIFVKRIVFSVGLND